MKKTDTCYYMSITKEENSAFVVAIHKGGAGGDPSQVVIDSKPDATTIGGFCTSGTVTTSTTTATTLSASSYAGGNGTAMSHGAEMHRRYEKTVYTLNETPSRLEACTGPRGQGRNDTPGPRAPLPPQVILQVLPSTPTFQHHNLLASEVHRECRMRLSFVFFVFFYYSSSSFSFSSTSSTTSST